MCVCAAPGAVVAVQMRRGRLRTCCSARVKVFCQGQLAGRRKMWKSEWLTRCPGSDRNRRRVVATTVSCLGCWVFLRSAVQWERLCASAAQASQAPLAKNRPEGHWASAVSLRSLMASSTRAWARW